ncbi:hypothetical protein FGG79_18975 [Bacillus sp. BHET2]|uniref:TnsD family Tn7-like transposition protein n=1 Tax=Bacillus sp. BHET2 TaxID=2583818 RepID=UPI00110EBECC|nr:TnsD family Tn7-like transposition protein [Bacillus sp. BHET2]TMU83780.1 hypothetical protein FGG79_18975 [Bacillus sp. BHET2]
MIPQLGFIPRLYNDELLYSWFARYHVHSPNESIKETMRDLFDKESQLAVPDLPSNLAAFYQKVSPFITIKLDELIEKHTFYYYYTRFTSMEFQVRVLELMKTSEELGAIHLIGGMSSEIKEKDFFYFCPQCLCDYSKTLGEPYWKIQHQLPGVLVCTIHECELQKSNVSFRPINRHEFVAARNDNCIDKAFKENFIPAERSVLLKIAKKLELLLSENSVHLTNYKSQLAEKGFLKDSGRVDQRLLFERFRAFYSEGILQKLQSNVDYYDESCWLKAITRKHRKTFHPIRHVLISTFLEETSNMNGYKDKDPFGSGPYPCLNKASSHYKQPVINKVEFIICARTNKQIGLFKCGCGFEYYSKEVKQGIDSLPIISKIKDFGPVWKGKLGELISTRKHSYREIARILGVDTKTVIKYTNLVKNEIVFEAISVKKNDLLNERKQVWLELLKNNSSSITELRGLNQSVYMYLYRNDKDWLKANYPKNAHARKEAKPRVDWEERDIFYLQLVKEKIKELLRLEPPVRVTISRIGANLGIRSLLQKNLSKLPRTQELILQRTETIEEFQIRRVQYISNELKNNEESLADWKIRRLAGLKNNLGGSVEEAISQLIN